MCCPALLLLAFPEWPYGDKRVVVLSSRALDFSAVRGARVEQMAGPGAEIISKLAAGGVQHVYVDGGITIQQFLRTGLVQRLFITRVPVLIGDGIPLFGSLPRDVRLRHVATHHYPSGLVKPMLQCSPSKEASEPQDLLTGSKSRSTEQIAQKFQILGELIENNQLDSALRDKTLLTEFDAGRLHLLSSNWMSKRYTGEVLGTHEISQLYRHRSELETTASESFLIMRTVVADSSDVVPGWFWFRELKVEQLSFLLFGLANDDPLPHLQTQAIQILRASRIEPPDKH